MPGRISISFSPHQARGGAPFTLPTSGVPRNRAAVVVALWGRSGKEEIMYLSRHRTDAGARWALDGRYLPSEFALDRLLELPVPDDRDFLENLSLGEAAGEPLLPPVEPAQEVDRKSVV